MAETTTPEVIAFSRDMTLRWPCRRGDFLLWFACRDLFAGADGIQCHDFWEMRDGYHVTLTNRYDDLPPWFQLHPTEVCDSFISKLMPKVKRGEYPARPLDGPNLWRLRSGDRVVWVGAERPERRSVNGILSIVDCRECALVIGEGDRGGIEEFIGYGRLSTAQMESDAVARCKVAAQAVKQLGAPRTWTAEWRLG